MEVSGIAIAFWVPVWVVSRLQRGKKKTPEMDGVLVGHPSPGPVGDRLVGDGCVGGPSPQAETMDVVVEIVWDVVIRPTNPVPPVGSIV